MVGEISSAWHTKDESWSWWYTPPLLVADALFTVEKCPREDAHDFWSYSVESSWRYLPTTRDIEPIACYLGLAGGIVKHGTARRVQGWRQNHPARQFVGHELLLR